jgi:hypothetical protein
MKFEEARLDAEVPFSHWDERAKYVLSRTSVIRNAPAASGVYGLYNVGRWIYIGHSGNICKVLLGYLSGQMPSVLLWEPKLFSFELCPYKERLRRHRELVLQFQPVCNRTMHPRSISVKWAP